MGRTTLQAAWGLLATMSLLACNGPTKDGPTDPVDADGDGHLSDVDCRDDDAEVHPTARERCDGIDNNCNGLTDEGDADGAEEFYVDLDGDGFGNPLDVRVGCFRLPGTVLNAEDCDDVDSSVFPGAEETCDGRDNDCNDLVDDVPAVRAWRDLDADGFGDPDTPVEACAVSGTGVVDNALDCDDANPRKAPDLDEVCDGIDNDCDGAADDFDDDTVGTPTFYRDQDGDGFGDDALFAQRCLRPIGYVSIGGDCDDFNNDVNPDGSELCDDNLDNDCDGKLDAADPDAADAPTWFKDDDKDGYGDPMLPVRSCAALANYVDNGDDCDDTDIAVNPTTLWYPDDDGDNYGDDGSAGTSSCLGVPFHVRSQGDCDDLNPAIHPGASEVCNVADDNCDGQIDEGTSGPGDWYPDGDGDGYGDENASPTPSCQPIAGHVNNALDCDDTSAEVSNGKPELCNGIDDDCDGVTDPPDAWWDADWPFRIPVEVTAASADVAGAPIEVYADFAIGQGFDPDTLRVVIHDCGGLGSREVPSQFLDTYAGLADPSDLPNNDRGTVVFLYDEDGDYSTLDTLDADQTVQVGLYFGGAHGAPTYTTDLSASASQLATTRTVADFSLFDGGLLSSLVIDSSPVLFDQRGTYGNGIYSNEWLTAAGGAGNLTVESGPVVAEITASGVRSNATASFSYSYRSWMFAGRPELWVQTTFEAEDDCDVQQTGEWVRGIRPMHGLLTPLANGSATLGDGWGDLYKDGYGLAWGWVVPPTHDFGIQLAGADLVFVANDSSGPNGSSAGTIPDRVTFVDNAVYLLLPHRGSYATIADDLTGLLEGPTVSVGSTEAI